jgi:opacity protein-like surface antigen
MTGELKRHDVDAIYEAAVQRARHLRWPPWPDLKPSRRRRRRGRRFSLILVSTVAILCAGLAVYAASAGWFGLPTLQSALRSLAIFDRKVASAPGADAIPQIVLAPMPESSTVTAEATPPPPAEAPLATEGVPLAPESAPAVAGTAPVPSVPVPAPPAVAAAPTEPARNRSESGTTETVPAPTDATPSAPKSTAAPAESAPNLPETATAAPPPDVPAPSPPGTTPTAPSVADAISDATAAPDPAAAKSVPASRNTAAMPKEPATDALPPQSFPLPPRRPVLSATRAPIPLAPDSAGDGDATASSAIGPTGPAPPSSGTASENIFHLGPGPRPILPPAPPANHAGTATGPRDALPPAPRPITGAGDPAPVSGGIVSHEPGAAPSTETAGSSVAAAPRPCPDGTGSDCPRARNWYVGAQLSVAANAVGTFTAPGVDVKGELETLGGTNLFAGYRSNLGTRFEAELFYRRHNFSDVTVNSDGGAGTFLGGSDLDGTSGNAQGHLSMTGMMANVFQDFRLMDSVTPFIGGGIGVAQVNVNNGGLQSAALVDGNDEVFAYQIGGGVNFALDDRLDLFFEYRYFATDDYDMQYVTGDTVQGKITSHNFGVGVRYGF